MLIATLASAGARKLDEALKNTRIRSGFSRATDDERARLSFLPTFIQRSRLGQSRVIQAFNDLTS
jgi:hypothetical protein